VAPLPMQILIYLFIGGVSLLINMFFFIGFTRAGIALNHSIVVSFIISALFNYLLCILILFCYKARWNTGAELFWYIFSVALMGSIDFGVTRLLITMVPFLTLHWSGAKLLSSIVGFIWNFALRKILVFPEKKKGNGYV
jgi:putative flippase GtrA